MIKIYDNDVALVIRQDDLDRFLKEMKEFDHRYPARDYDINGFGKIVFAKDVFDEAEHFHDVVPYQDHIDRSDIGFCSVLHWRHQFWDTRGLAYQFFQYVIDTYACDFVRVGCNDGDIEEHYGLDSGIVAPHIERSVWIFSNGELKDW